MVCLNYQITPPGFPVFPAYIYTRREISGMGTSGNSRFGSFREVSGKPDSNTFWSESK